MNEDPQGPVWVELIPHGQTEKATFWWPALRLTQGLSKFEMLHKRMQSMLTEWNGPTACRAPRNEAESGYPSMTPVGNIGISVEDKRTVTLLASESLFHIRSALDLLVYQLAWRDSGIRQERTAFPVVKKEAEWNKRAKSELKGVDQVHIDHLRSLQPFAGREWTQRLATLSNRDKHRTTVEITPSVRFKVDRSRVYADPLGHPDFCGFAIEDLRLHLRLMPATHDGEGTARLDADVMLVRVAEGAVGVMNHFLKQEGLSPIEFSVPEDLPSLPHPH